MLATLVFLAIVAALIFVANQTIQHRKADMQDYAAGAGSEETDIPWDAPNPDGSVDGPDTAGPKAE